MASPVNDTYSAPSGATVYGGRFAPPSADAFAAAIADLPDDTWSNGLIGASEDLYIPQIPVLKNDPNFTEYYTHESSTKNATVTSQNPWSYSSGDYAPELNAYQFTGGGHDDWLGSETIRLELAKMKWRLTDYSCQYSDQPDPDAPIVATDEGGWFPWPNEAGRRTPSATHMYGGLCWMPSRNAFFVRGASTFKGPSGSPGGYFWIDGTTGYWDETHAKPVTVGGGTDSSAHWVPTIERIFALKGGGAHAYLIDPVTGESEKCANYLSHAPERLSIGCIVPDPVNEGKLAYVAPHLSSTSALCIATRIDVSPSPVDHFSAINYDNSMPEALQTGRQRWIYPGTGTKIIVVAPAGIWLLDMDGWVWSEQIAGLPEGVTISSGSGGAIWKRAFHASPYDSGGRRVICLIDPSSDAGKCGQLYAVKLAASHFG